MKRLYALLLYLFPRAYREEYGEELRIVFDLALDDAMASGRFEVAHVALRELSSLPKAIIHQYFWEGVRHFTWLTEMISTIIMWMWIALGMLVPLLLRLFPKSEDQLQTA